MAATRTRELSPARMESYLQTAGLNGDVLIPADAALQLQQGGMDIAAPLGWDVASLEEAAALGHDIVMPVARLQARLQPDQMKAVADIMREAPNAKNALEASTFNEDLPDDLDAYVEKAEDDAFERSAIEGEVDRLRGELTEAVKSVPHLQAQIVGSADPDTTTRQVVEKQLGLMMRRALELSRVGIPVSETLSRFSFQGLVKDERGRLATPEEAEAAALRQAEEDALAPFWDEVWGRLDADSLRTDFPDARRELAYRHGRGLFAKKGEGLAVDELADELRERGLLDADADSSTLVERLKELARPNRRKARARQAQGMLQAEEKNALGVPLSRVTRIEGSVTREELDAALSALAGRDLPNLIEGVTAQVNANQKRKLESKVAGDKSMENGFQRGEHRGVAAQIENAWKWAAEAVQGGDKNGMPDVNIRRFVSALNINGQDAFAWMTVKETPTGLRIYSVELMDEKKLRDIVGNGTAETATTTLHRSYEEIIERLSSPVNEQGDSLFQAAPASQSGMDAVRKQYEGTEQWMKAPNGKPTKLTERQWLQVRTPEFKAWFGDWENDPKNVGGILDENGEPKVFTNFSKIPRKTQLYIIGIPETLAQEISSWEYTAKSPFSESYYNKPGKSWENTPDGIIRISDHWNFESRGKIHARTDKFVQNGNWVKAQYDARTKTYKVLAEYPPIPDSENYRMQLSRNEKNKFERAKAGDDIEVWGEVSPKIGKKHERVAFVGISSSGKTVTVRDSNGKTKRKRGKFLTSFGEFFINPDGHIKSATDNIGTFDAGTRNILYQSAWHGTPHRFDEFTLDAIGSGEGAQAHGWGLYFAEDKEVSEEYRRKLIPSDSDALLLFGDRYELTNEGWQSEEGGVIDYDSPEALAMNALSDNGSQQEAIDDIKEKIKEEESYLEDEEDEEVRNNIEKLNTALEYLQNNDVEQAEFGQLFEVDIPENDVLLDEDKTLNEQPEAVQSALLKIAKDNEIEFDEDWTGENFYDELADRLGSPREASEALNAAGIKGITYEGEQDGRCFVVFDDKAIRVLDTYYQRLRERAPALGSTTQDASGRYVIQLFAGANLSTLVHETAHAFFLEMERLEREGLADEQLLTDLAALREWTSALDDDAALKLEYDRYLKSAYGGANFESLPAWIREDARNRAKQEMLARGFEQYLREGKAPSRKLEGLFSRFRKWLMRVYREARDLHVELTDEVRDVFDRMLAHESEMDLAAEAADVRDETRRLLDSLELKGAKRLEIEGLIAAAKGEAAEKMRHVRDANRDRQRRAWAKEAQAQMESEQVYVTRKAIRRTPLDLNSFNDVNGEELGRALVKKLPGSATRKEGGAEPEVFAAEHGYESAAAMARDIINSPTPGQRVKQLIDERQAEHDALFDAADYLFEQEQLAEQQERIAEALEAKIQRITAETRYRREVEGKTVGGETVTPMPEDYEDFGRLARWRVGRDQLRAQAADALGRQPMSEELLPETFRRAASRAMQAERRAILRGDFETALQANYQARINIELARQSAERRDMVRKLTKRAKKFLDMDKADTDARFAVFVLSQNVGLFNPTRKMLANATDKGRDNINAFFSRMKEEGYLAPEDVDTELFTTGGDWKAMTWEQFRPYADMMTMIMHMERESRTLATAQGRVDMEERAETIANSIYANNAHREPGALAKRNNAFELLKKFHAAHLKADTIVLLLDGDEMGPAWQAIIRPINKATWKRAERLKRERDALKNLFSVYTRRELVNMKSKRFTVPGVADPITKEQALAVLLNCGNAGNLQRLMTGQNLTKEQVRAIIDTLDERDVTFAQAVWDYLETFRKEAFDLEESLTGVRPEAVKAQAVPTRFGVLRGGYYPVAYDRELSAKPVDTDKIGTQTGGMFPSVDHGSLKQRTAAGLGTPLSLSLDVIPSHVAETVHMLAFRRPVIEVAKILRRKKVNDAIQETAGVATTKALDDWLRYVAGERPARNGWDRAASWARKNAALYTMGFKLTTMLAQVTGLLSSVSEIGPRWVLRGVVDTYGHGNPRDVYRTVMALSPMMRNRITSIDREVFEVSSKLMDMGSSSRVLDPFVRMKSFMETKGFVPMGWVQMAFADLPTWNGAYAKALSENGGDIEAAVEYADAVVERTQVGGAEKDLAAVQRGRELGKLMTMFYSYFSALYNLSARRVAMLRRKRDAASVYRLATLALLTWFAEPVLMGMLLGKAPDEDDDEDWFAWAAKEAFFNPFNMVVGVREAANMVDSYISGKGGRYRLSSALDVFDSFMRFGAQVGKAVEGEADAKDVILAGGKALGQATGFVNSQEVLILETFWNWLDGTSPELELGNLIRFQSTRPRGARREE